MYQESFNENFALVKDTLQSEEELALYNDALVAFEEYGKIAADIMAARDAGTGTKEEIMALQGRFIDELDVEYDKIDAALNGIMELKVAAGDAGHVAMEDQAKAINVLRNTFTGRVSHSRHTYFIYVSITVSSCYNYLFSFLMGHVLIIFVASEFPRFLAHWRFFKVNIC